ncbi:MAG TPA: pilus assembly protein TadG-related protein [Verrucomicrobiae bacterium]|nr:pilus assembly protein TadG-related protein [Verrucomicrobiae bacterium]
MRFVRKTIRRALRREHGQMLVMFVLMIVVLIGFVGLGVDLGFAYISRARLSKAVDAACLNGMRNYYQGTTQASLIASNTFALNYGSCGRDVAPPTLNISFNTTGNNVLLNISAQVAINTFFIRVLPAIGGYSWRTLTVGDSAQATRTKVILALVLDRSGSMNPTTGTTKGGSTLPGAVQVFINYFDDTIDEASMASFASTATLDIPMEQPFKSDIITAANNMNWCGGTLSIGGLTNALLQENSVTIPANQVALKAVVFFTDGLANMIQQTLKCSATTSNTWNFGGHDGGTTVAFWNPATTTKSCADQNNSCNDGYNLSGCSPPCNATQFYSTTNGVMEDFTQDNVTAEAQYQCVQIANLMRANNILVYCIGLGGSSVDTNFLAEVANANGVDDPRQPEGLALYASTPSDVQAAFVQVANDILYRLTQ